MNRAFAMVVWLACSPVSALEVNLANQAELESVAGIGPDLATRILAARRERPFNGWNDFRQRVRGVGTARAARLSIEGVTVGGATYPAAAPAPAAPASALPDPASAAPEEADAPAAAAPAQPKNAATSSRRLIVSPKPSAISSRV
jgi:competence protein ComEA